MLNHKDKVVLNETISVSNNYRDTSSLQIQKCLTSVSFTFYTFIFKHLFNLEKRENKIIFTFFCILYIKFLLSDMFPISVLGYL